MCGRYYLPEAEEEYPKFRVILEEMNRKEPLLSRQVHGGEIFPSQTAPVILVEGGVFTVRPMRWGFPRPFGKGLCINSRSETADQKPLFQKALRERRCLIPMAGFYEWQHGENGVPGKDQFAFSLPASGRLLYVAGIYESFSSDCEKGGFYAFSLFTQEADAFMHSYHHRMPVFLQNERAKKRWLTAPPSTAYAELRPLFETPLLCAAVAHGTKNG